MIEQDKDFKNTKKLNWLSKKSPLVEIKLLELDHLLKTKKVEEGVNFEDALNETTEFYTNAFAEPSIKTLKIGDII
jgi:glutamyl-tRNA synthetase